MRMTFSEMQSVPREMVIEPSNEELIILFAQNFSIMQGRFIYCIDELDLVTKLTELKERRAWKKIFCREPILINMLQQRDFRGLEFGKFAESRVIITGCKNLIARSGSILMTSAQFGGRNMSVYTPLRICVAYTSQIVYDIYERPNHIQKTKQELQSLITLADGTSSTVDIEEALAMDIRGPQEVFCFVVEDSSK